MRRFKRWARSIHVSGSGVPIPENDPLSLMKAAADERALDEWTPTDLYMAVEEARRTASMKLRSNMALLLAKHVLGMRCVATAAVMSDFDKTKAFVKFENFKSWCVFMFRWVCHASDSGEAALCKWMPKMRNECGLGSLLRFVAGKASTVGSAWEENIPRSSREGRKRVWGFRGVHPAAYKDLNVLQRMPQEAQSGPTMLAIFWRSLKLGAAPVVSSPKRMLWMRAAPSEHPVSPNVVCREEITMSKKMTNKIGERGQPYGTPP